LRGSRHLFFINKYFINKKEADIYYEDYMHMRGIKIGGTKGSFQMMMAKFWGFTLSEKKLLP
jgi:hypothetical protein